MSYSRLIGAVTLAALAVLAVVILARPGDEGSVPVAMPTIVESSAATDSSEVSTTGLRDIPVTDIEPPLEAYDPVLAGEPLPDGYRDSLGRDWILPVYNPTFRSAADTDWPADSLVIGVEIAGDARAYPISFLTRREMVIDRIGGVPVLVSW